MNHTPELQLCFIAEADLTASQDAAIRRLFLSHLWRRESSRHHASEQAHGVYIHRPAVGDGE